MASRVMSLKKKYPINRKFKLGIQYYYLILTAFNLSGFCVTTSTFFAGAL